LKCSTAGEKTPIETIIPRMVNNKKPIEANANFISLVLIREINDMIVSNVDKPRNENRMNISISFIGWTFLFS
jgi:fructose-1,6-bisphosphatase/sedoheptulose 1,7-bisphosphatase-like protein